MAFLDSALIRPVYDVHDGGAPVGYRCMAYTQNRFAGHSAYRCNRLLRTLVGMRAHQRVVHKIRPQAEIEFEHFDSIAPTR